MIAVIDYGAGNLHSVKNALDYLGVSSVVTGKETEILKADKVILPGVGAFGDAMTQLRAKGLEAVTVEAAKQGKPFLGICLGLHLLFEESEEAPGIKGLGILPGRIAEIPHAPGLKIPHIGWNNITLTKESRILGDVEASPFVYFVHSYYIQPEDSSVVSAYTQYGSRLGIAVEKDNLFATQFHPEKSGRAGLEILKKFTKVEG